MDLSQLKKEKNMRKVIFLFYVLLSVSGGYVFASPPSIVYRVDTRSYDEIFRSGFHSWGRDYNIVAHINGATCSTEGSTSGFISTAANLDAARAIANEHLSQGRNTYLYTIRADYTFFSGPASVDYLQQYNPLSPLSIMSLEMARRADEWDAVNEIPPENVRDVIEYRVDGTYREYSNPRYLQVNTTGNPEPYTRNLEEVLRYYNFPVRLPGRTTIRLSSCFASCSGALPLRHRASSKNQCIDEPEDVRDFKTMISSFIF